MLFDDSFVDSLPQEAPHAVLAVFRHFRDFNSEVPRIETADRDKLIAENRYEWLLIDQ